MKRLTFSFDNGPWPGATEPLLDFLARRSIKATFFVVGQRLQEPGGIELARRAHAEGHWIGNHTLTHTRPLGEDGGLARVEREIGETERLIGELAHPHRFFRPNGGGAVGPHLLSAEAIGYLARNRYSVVTWTSAPGDWIAPHRAWLDNAIRDVERSDWTLLVLHDRFIAPMLDTLDRFLDVLATRGIEIVQDLPPACLVMRDGVVTGDRSTFSIMGEAGRQAAAQ